MPKTQLSSASCYANGEMMTTESWIKSTIQLDFGLKQYRSILISKKASLVLSRTGFSSHI